MVVVCDVVAVELPPVVVVLGVVVPGSVPGGVGPLFGGAAIFAGEKALAGMGGATAVEPVTMKGPTCTVSVHLPWSCVRRWNHQLP